MFRAKRPGPGSEDAHTRPQKTRTKSSLVFHFPKRVDSFLKSIVSALLNLEKVRMGRRILAEKISGAASQDLNFWWSAVCFFRQSARR